MTARPLLFAPVLELLESRLLLSAGAGPPWTSTHSFTNTADGAHPYTVTGSSSQITVDLSSLPAGTEVYRAVFHHNRYGNTGYYQQAPGATSPLQVQAHDEPDVWLEVLAPKYRDFDCTAAAQRAMLLPDRLLVVDMISFPGFNPADGVRVDVWTNAEAVHTIDPVTGITVKHRDGDTMVTFHEVVDYLTNPSATADEYNAAQAAAAAGGYTYRIYRSEVPIDAVSIRQAELVTEVAPLSNWNLGYYNGYYSGSSLVPRLPVDDEVLSAVDEGIAVRRAGEADPDGAYYAVSTVLWGEEDLSQWTAGENAAAAPLVEDTGPGMVLLREKILDQDWFYESQVDRYYYNRWEAPPTYAIAGAPMDYLVAVPNDSISPRPVDIALHCWGGNINGGYGWWYEANHGSLFLATNQVPYDWWTGSHENYGTVRPFLPVEGNDGGVVSNFQQMRILSFLDDFVATNFSVDLDHVVLSGNSMGGSGAIMWAARQPDRFAYADGWVGVYDPRNSPQFKGSFEIVYGQDAWGCEYLDTGMAAFDYWDTPTLIRSDPGQEVPYLCFANGKNDSAIGWPQAWDTVQALIEARQPFKFYWSQAGHSTRAQLPAGNDRYIGIDIDRDTTLPAFTNGSLDEDLGDGTPTSGDSEGHINRWTLWQPETSVDLPGRWEMTVYLQSTSPAGTCTVDVTPRRTQQFAQIPGMLVRWENIDVASGAVVQSGTALADAWGLVTLPQVIVSKTYNRVVIELTCMPGDANQDGAVDGADYTIWADHYLWDETSEPAVVPWSEGGWALGNFTEDTIVDGADYTIWADHYHQSVGGAPAGEGTSSAAPVDAVLLGSRTHDVALGAAILLGDQRSVSPLNPFGGAGTAVGAHQEYVGVSMPAVDPLSTPLQGPEGLLNAEAVRQRPPVRRRISRADWCGAPDVLDLLEAPSLSVLDPVW